MADPFEVRMRFTSQLQHLNASVTSAQKVAQYALKHRDMEEDLHSCILEQLEHTSLNTRANILYFIEVLCDQSQKEDYQQFICMLQRDILKVVDLVAPEDGSGAANVKIVRKVLGDMKDKGFLSAQTVEELEECIRDRDGLAGVVKAATENGHGIESPGSPSPELVRTSAPASTPDTRGTGAAKVDKRLIEQRIEEDRERHKRQREKAWQVEDPDEEFGRLWEETSEMNEDDYERAREDRVHKERSTNWAALVPKYG